jgi:DNA-binding MarR family transcriptional regulator
MGPDMPLVDEVFLRDDERVAKLGRTAFTREELGVLELLNGRHTIKEIARKTRAGTFAVTKIVYRLTMAGLIHRRALPMNGPAGGSVA